MSAVVGEPAAGGSQKYVNFDEYVDFQVNKTRAGIRYTDLLLAVVTVLLVVAGYLLLFVVADQWLIEGGFSEWTRIGLLAAVVGFIGVWTTWKIVLPYWKRVTALYAAKELEGTQPQLKSSLLTLVDLKQAGRAVSPHILTAMEKRAALQLSQVDVEQAVDRRPLMRLAYALLGVVVALCLYTVLSPKPVGASLLRALIPIADIGVATRTQIMKVDPGATSILARSQLEVTVDVKGEIPPEATLLYTTHDRSLVDEAIVLRDTGEGLNRFRGTLAGPNGRGLLQDFTYRVLAGDAESETFPVSVKQAPYATVESVTYTYPQYMGLDPQTQSGGDIEAWEGTKVTMRGVTNMPVAAATLKFHDTEDVSVKAEELPLRLVDSTHFELTWTLQFRRDGTFAHFYQVDLRTEEGQRDPVPRLYSQNLRRDLPPEVKLLHPSGDLDLPSNAVLPISFAARDPDFMLRSIRLKFEHREMPLEAKTRHLYDAPPYQPEYQGQGEIRLSDFESVVKPGDVLTFYLEAWDNMAPLDREGNRSVTPKINIRITPEESREEVEQRREEQAQAAQERLDEAQSQQTPEQGDTEPSPDGTSGESEATEPSAETSQPTETGDTGGQIATEQQPGEQATGSEPTATPQNAEPSESETQKQEGAEQQPQQGEKTPNGSQQQQSADGGKSGQQSKTGKSQSSPSGTEQQQKSATDQAGSQPGAQQKGAQSQSKPGEEASDDEALAKLLNKYKDEIKQQREQEQQQQQDDGPDAKQQQGDEAQQGSQSSASKLQQKSSGDQGSEGSDSETGESNKTGDESTPSPDTSRSRSEGTKRDDANKGEQQNQTGDDGEQGGDPAQSPNPEAQQKQPGAEQPGEKPPTPGSQRDPRESQDPRTAEQPQSQTGKPQPKSDNGEQQQQGTGEQSQPMTGESDSSQSTSPSGQQSKGSGTPSAEKPASEGSSKPEGDAGRPSNEAAEPSGEPEQSGANDPNASKTSKTGDQPKGANEQNPGEGRKDGQRSDQPQTGEKGSSQQTSEGQKSDQSGAGETSDSPGAQSEGAEGQSSPGEGKQAGDKPGQPKSGSGSKSQPGQSGSEGSESGDPQQSGSEGAESAEGTEKASGSKPQAGEKPGSKADSGKPENKGQGQQGQSEESPSGDEKPGESGAKGEKPSGEEEKSGNEQSGSGGGEKPQGDEASEKPSDSGGGKKPGSKPQGDKPQGAGEQGSESKGSGEQPGSDSGGSESGGSESGSESGGGKSGEGEPGEGSSSSSSDPGNSQQTGKPGSGQAAGGQVGAGGRGTNEGPVPPGSGGQGNAEAAPAEPGDLRDRKKATELVLQKLQDEVSRGEVSPELLQDLGWTEQNLRDFMDRLDRRLSDTGEDESPEATARRRQFDEILRGIDYESEGTQKIYDTRDRQVENGTGPIPRLPAPSEFRRAEESMRQKLSRETKSKK